MESDPNASTPSAHEAAAPRHTGRDWASLVFFLLVVGFSILAALAPGHRFYGHGLAAGAVLAYAIYAWWTTAHSAALSFRYGETLYLLGYVATICGLGAIAWQIGQDASLLEKENIPGVLARGSLALLSTVIGLIGMNYLRSHGQAADQQHREADESNRRLTEQLEQMLRRTEQERAQIFLGAFQATDLTEHLSSMTRSLGAASASMATFRADAEQAQQAWATMLERMNGANAALGHFQQVAEAIAPAWAQITERLQQAAELGQATQSATTAIEQLGTRVGELNNRTTAFAAGMSQAHSEAIQMAGTLHERLAQLPPLADGVGRFVELANRVAPTMEVLGNTFRDIKDINENLRLASGGLESFNVQLNAANTATGAIASNSVKLSKATDDLVAGAENHTHKLERLAAELEQDAEKIKTLAPQLDLLKSKLDPFITLDLAGKLGSLAGDIARLAEATKAVRADLAGTGTDLEALRASAKEKLDDVSAVVGSFLEVTRNLVDQAGRPRR